MCLKLLFTYWAFIKFVESTDLAAVYSHGVLHLKGVDQPSATYSLHETPSIYFKTKEFAYPVGLAYDPLSKSLFITDVNDYNTDIYAFSTTSQDVPNAKTIISKDGISSIESLSYNPAERVLYWTDSYKHGIYSAHTQGVNEGGQSVNLIDSSVRKPRGIASDYCNRHLFWSERDKKLRRVTDHDILSGANERITEASSDIFYQTVAYDSREKQLIWAETVGDHASNSSCNILKFSSSKELELFATFERCYPFSLTLDDKFIYWSDWAMGGVMRLSKTDPKDLVKLIETPPLESAEGRHNGAFGIVALNNFDPEECHKSDDSSDKSLTTEVEEKEVEMLIEPMKRLEFTDTSFSPLDIMRGKYQRLYYMFVVSLCIGCFFMFSTFYLVFRAKLWSIRRTLPPQSDGSAPAVVEVAPVGKHKKHRRFSPFQQPGILSSRSQEDGVRINIEDCCQMTLCDTPCYTSLQKEGKSYLNGQKSPPKKTCEDKKGLLDDFLA